MVFNQATINRTLSEIVNQLRQGSAQYETKHENKFTAALMRSVTESFFSLKCRLVSLFNFVPK